MGATVTPIFRDGEMEDWRGCHIFEDTVNTVVSFCSLNKINRTEMTALIEGP